MAHPEPYRRDATDSPSGREGDSAAAIVHGAKRKSYIPYQDSPYYNDSRGNIAYPDNNVYTIDENLKRRDGERRYVYERIRRRRRQDDESDEEELEHHSKSQRSRRPRQGDHEDEPHEYARRRHDARKDRHHEEDHSSGHDSHHPSHSSHRSKRDRSVQDHDRPPPAWKDPTKPPRQDALKPPEKYTPFKALKSAAMAAGVEAVRCRNEPGDWAGVKAKRIALAGTVGIIIGALRNGRNLNSGKKPYAEAAMTGFYAIDFLKRVARHTEFDEGARKEQRDWHENAGDEGSERERDWGRWREWEESQGRRRRRGGREEADSGSDGGESEDDRQGFRRGGGRRKKAERGQKGNERLYDGRQ